MSIYRFGRYEFDQRRRSLLDGQTAVPLSAKLFGLLSCFVGSGGRPVTKDQLAAEVWPDDDPSDATITQHVMLLRKLLGDSAKAPDYILTVPGVGYAFVAGVSHEGEPIAFAGQSGIERDSPVSVWREYLAAEQYFIGGAQGSVAGLREALRHYQAALELDRTFAPAWSGVASIYSFMAYYGYVPWSSVLDGAFQATRKAIELDPQSCLAYCLHSQLQLVQWNVSESFRLLEIASKVDAQSSHPYHLSAFIRQWCGDLETAATEAKRSLAADASATLVQALYANALAGQGDLSQALAIYSNVLQVHPENRVAREARCDAYAGAGQFHHALADLAKLPHTAVNASRLGCVYALMGDRVRAMGVLSELQRRASLQYVQPHCIAQLYIALDHHEEALALAHRAIETHDLKFPTMHNSPLLVRPMRDKRLRARFTDLGEHLRTRRRGVG